MQYNQNFKTKKSLGQHFLIDESIIDKIINNCDEIAYKNVLEIGSGSGNLTKKLLPKCLSLTAIDFDDRVKIFMEEIKENFSDKFTFYNMDALGFDEIKNIKSPRVIVANLPYNVGTLMLIKWLKIINHFDYFVLMFQKEVAERIVAKVNTTNYGRLSIFTSIYANVEILFDVSPQSFLPTPKVFSSVIKLTPKKNSFIDDVLLTKLEKVTNVAFSMRRKMIKQSIKKILNVNLESLNIDENKRPQEVSLEEFIKIANTL